MFLHAPSMMQKPAEWKHMAEKPPSSPLIFLREMNQYLYCVFEGVHSNIPPSLGSPATWGIRISLRRVPSCATHGFRLLRQKEIKVFGGAIALTENAHDLEDVDVHFFRFDILKTQCGVAPHLL